MWLRSFALTCAARAFLGEPAWRSKHRFLVKARRTRGLATGLQEGGLPLKSSDALSPLGLLTSGILHWLSAAGSARAEAPVQCLQARNGPVAKQLALGQLLTGIIQTQAAAVDIGDAAYLLG